MTTLDNSDFPPCPECGGTLCGFTDVEGLAGSFEAVFIECEKCGSQLAPLVFENMRRELEMLQSWMHIYLEQTKDIPGDTLQERIAWLMSPPTLKDRIRNFFADVVWELGQ